MKCETCDNDECAECDLFEEDGKQICWRCRGYHYVKGEYKIRTSDNTDANGNYVPAKRRK